MTLIVEDPDPGQDAITNKRDWNALHAGLSPRRRFLVAPKPRWSPCGGKTFTRLNALGSSTVVTSRIQFVNRHQHTRLTLVCVH
ncbi:hypothetical protein ASD00_27025 [Ensifer sp. Root31]|nr:hypothetical protein ASD00_27025 [Ensifer sp. Root31]